MFLIKAAFLDFPIMYTVCLNWSFLMYKHTENQLFCKTRIKIYKMTPIFTARKRSLRRLCFYRCLSVHTGGGCAWFYSEEGVCVVLIGGCMVLFGGHVWFYLGGLWFYSRGKCGFIWGACVVLFGGHAWFFFHFFRIQWDMVNERVVRILLECILVYDIYTM